MIAGLSFGQRKYADDFDKSNIISLITAPGAYGDGFNYGVIYEYTNPWVYVGSEIFAFPKLNHTGNQELSYHHIIGRFGLNKYFGQVTKFARIYSGGRAGWIVRGGDIWWPKLLGLEAGFDFILWDSITIGASITSDLKTDSKIYSDSNHTVNSVFVKLGIKF